MSKLQRFNDENTCYHVTTSTQGRRTVLSDAENAHVVVQALQFIRGQRAYLLAYTVMPDHVHAVLVPRNGYTVSQVMQTVKGYVARTINARNGQRGKLWQQSFYDRMIRDEQQLFEAIEYVHMNPVVAGLVVDAEAYEFSSAGRPESVDLETFYRD